MERDRRVIPIMTMGPICITPELKRQGCGKILLDYSLEKAKELGCGAVCFEGNFSSTEKVDLLTQVSTVFDITVLQRVGKIETSRTADLNNIILECLRIN